MLECWSAANVQRSLLHCSITPSLRCFMTVGLEHYLTVSFLLFALGLLGVIMRRNLLVIYMSLELMLNAANLALVSFSRFNDKLGGQVLVFFIITVAAAEVAVGLALIVALYRKRQTAHVEDLTSMKL